MQIGDTADYKSALRLRASNAARLNRKRPSPANSKYFQAAKTWMAQKERRPTSRGALKANHAASLASCATILNWPAGAWT